MDANFKNMIEPVLEQTRAPGFCRLPIELRLMIWERALLPSIVGYIPGKHTRNSFTLCEAETIARVCGEAREAVRRSHHFVFRDNDMVLRRMNPVKDTFLTCGMILPRGEQYVHDLGRSWMPLPIHKLASTFHNSAMALESGLLVREPLIDLDIRHSPELREFTMLWSRAPASAWIPDCQAYGPDPVSEPEPASDLYYDWSDGAMRQAVDHFKKNKTVADAGRSWPNDDGRFMNGRILDDRASTVFAKAKRAICRDRFLEWVRTDNRDPNPVPRPFLVHQCYIPKIGLLGYSANDGSMGGQWAGFRYYTATKNIEFSPLLFHEVEDYMLAGECYQGIPDLVVRLWVVRPSEEKDLANDPRHFWRPVVAHAHGESESTRKIRVLWQFTRLRLGTAFYSSGPEWRNESDLGDRSEGDQGYESEGD